MQRFNFSYDKENDDLFLFNPKSKSKGSVELGYFIFDYNNKKELVGLQIMNASRLIKDVSNEKEPKIIKEVLDNLIDCGLDIKIKNNLMVIKVYLSSKINRISPVLSMPRIQKMSPALAYI